MRGRHDLSLQASSTCLSGKTYAATITKRHLSMYKLTTFTAALRRQLDFDGNWICRKHTTVSCKATALRF